MSEIRKKYDEEFKKNAVKLSYASPKPVKEIAANLGVTEGILYRWRRRYTADGDKTRFATLEEENRALSLELLFRQLNITIVLQDLTVLRSF